MDVLDLPYVESLNCSYFEFDYFEEAEQSNSRERVGRPTQSIRFPQGYSEKIYARGGIVPMLRDTIETVAAAHWGDKKLLMVVMEREVATGPTGQGASDRADAGPGEGLRQI